MGFEFCGYDENTTVEKIREDFSNLDTCRDKVKNYRPDIKRREKNQGPFDAVMALILGGAGTGKQYQKNYCAAAFNNTNNGASTWDRNAINYINRNIINDLIKNINDVSTIKDVYRLISNDKNLRQHRTIRKKSRR